MIIKLRPVLIAAAVAILAVICVWRIADGNPVAQKPESDLESTRITVSQPQADPEQSFFPYFRLQREKIRSQQLELLKEIINNPNTDDKSKQSALARLLTITGAMEMELKAEGLLKAQGFKEGVVILQDAAASVIISGSPLSETDEATIKSQVAGILKLDSRQVSIINKE